MTRPDPAFDDPWHAQLFALTVHLNETGLFSWTQWADAFGATLARHGLSKQLDGGDDYFTAWLETLERLLTQNGTTDGATLAQLKAQWTAAYLNTPHSQPVAIDDPSYSSTSSTSA